MANRTVAQLMFDIDSRGARKVNRDLDKIQRKLNRTATLFRSVQTVGFATLIGIAASSGTAAASIAVMGTAAVAATGAFIALGSFGIAAIVGLAAATLSETEYMQKTLENSGERISKSWRSMIQPLQDPIHSIIHDFTDAFETVTPAATKVMESIGRMVQGFTDRLFDPKIVNRFSDLLETSVGNTLHMYERLVGLTDDFADGILTAAETIDKAFGDNTTAIVEGFKFIADEIIPSFGDLVAALIGLSEESFVPFLNVLDSLVDGFTDLAGVLEGTDFIEGTLGGLSNFLDSFFKVVGGLIGELGPGMGNVLTSLGELLEALEAPLNRFGHLFEDMMNLIVILIENFSPVLERLGEAFTEVMGVIGPAAMNTLLELSGPLSDSLIRTIDALEPLLLSLAEALVAMVEALTPAFIDLLDDLVKILEALTPVLVEIVDALTDFIEKSPWVVEAVAKLWLTFKLLKGLKTIVGAFQKTGTALASLGGVMRLFVLFLRVVWKPALFLAAAHFTLFHDKMQWFRDGFMRILREISRINLFDSGRSIIGTLIAGILDAMGPLGDAVQAAADLLGILDRSPGKNLAKPGGGGGGKTPGKPPPAPVSSPTSQEGVYVPGKGRVYSRRVASSSVGDGGNTTVNNITINNPRGETAENSIIVTMRQMEFLAG